MIKEISTAIMSRFNDDPAGLQLRTDLTGGLWFSEAPTDTVEPYAVFTWDGSTVDELMGGRYSRLETASITVTIYSKNDDGGAEVFELAETFMQLYDWCTLTYPAGNYEHISFRRLSIVNRGKSDSIWVVEIDYEAMFEH